MNRLWIILAVVIAFTSIARAETSVTLPLDGYYRPGKFFPVRVTADHDVSVEVQIPGGIGAYGSGKDVTLPVMLLSSSENMIKVVVDGKSSDVPVRPLEGNQRLVMAASPELAESGRTLFAGAPLIRVALPPSGVGGITAAYESTDAVLFREEDMEAWKAVSGHAALNRFIVPAFGMKMAVLTAAPPQWVFKWRREGRWSVLDCPVRGPANSLDSAGVYDAAAPVVASRPLNVRSTVWLGMAMFSILAVGAGLFRRWGGWAVIVVAVVWMIAVVVYHGTQSPISERRATIIAPMSGDERSADTWEIRTAIESSEDNLNTFVPVRPIFSGQATQLGMRIEVLGDRWIYRYKLPAREKIVFVQPDFDDSKAPVQAKPAEQSVFTEIARKCYLRSGEKVLQAEDGSIIVRGMR